MPFITRLPALTGADPYPDALLALDFVGARRGPQYYKALGVTTADITKVPGWTYTGGASTGSYAAKDDGSLQLFAQNVPRITDAGYWAEEARTNLLLRSQEFDNAAWIKSAATVTANQAVAPDGTATADKVVNTPSVLSYIAQTSPAMSNSTTYVKTVYVALAPGNTAPTFVSTADKGAGEVATYFNISTLAITGTDAATSSLAAVGGGWYRLTHVFTTAASGTPNWGVFYLGAYGSTPLAANFYIWQADLQAGSFATSPIPTTSVAVTRAADVGYVSGLVVPSAYSVLSDAPVPLAGPPYSHLWSYNDGTNSNATTVYLDRGALNSWAVATVGGVGQAALDLGATTAGAAQKVAFRLAANDFAASRNGGAVVTDASGTLPTVTTFQIGRNATGSYWSGPIRRIVIYPRAFGNSELQAITTAGAY